MNSLINFFLSNLDEDSTPTTLFNEDRVHLFTFLRVNTTIRNEELMEDFVRIIRCQNKNYQVIQEEQDCGRFYTQTFENIFIGSSVEGAAIMTLAPDDALEFTRNFKTVSIIPRYLWIYLLVYIQRQTLIGLTKSLMSIDMETIYDSKSTLGNIIAKLYLLKIKSYFTDISNHTQHNSFYRFCANKLSIRLHFDEIREKSNDLSIILQEKELQHDKEIEQKEEQRSKKLGQMLAFIAIAQVFFAFVAFSKADVFFDWTSSFYVEYKLFFDLIITLLAAGSIFLSMCIAYRVLFKK